VRYLVTLTPLEPFLFGGDNTFGKRGSETEGTYLVKSRHFPQQSAILGMLKKEIMIQSNTLTRKVRGEWVDRDNKQGTKHFVGDEKFDITASRPQNFGAIKSLEPIFLLQGKKKYIKKVAISDCTYKDGLLQGYNPKEDIYDNFVEMDSEERLSSTAIFQAVEQIGNKKGGEENSLFKKTSYLLKNNFQFAFYMESDYALQNSIVHLGADQSSFQLKLKEDATQCNYLDTNGYLTLLSDSYITIPLKGNCDFAITSEISYQALKGKKSSMIKKEDPKKNKQNNPFEKTKKVFLYEKGSIILNPSYALIQNLNNKNCQQIGYNKYTYKGKNK